MIRDLKLEEFPELLKEINDPPKSLRYIGELPKKENKLLAIVGTRKYSTYGREACETIIEGLRGYPITIISGLALGIDSIAHIAAMKAGLQTIAVPGSGLGDDVIYPRSHFNLSKEIVESGGGLLSEYPDDMRAALWTFPKRNRIMAGMCHATLIIEAEIKSGTLITSRLATEYNREVGAVPGPITSPVSDGPNMLIRLGAALIRDSKDVLELLDLKKKDEDLFLFDTSDLSLEEKLVLDLLESPVERDKLMRLSKLESGKINAILSLLEIKGLIQEEMGQISKNF